MIMFILNICGITGYYAATLPDSFCVADGGELELSTAFSIDAVSTGNIQPVSAGISQKTERASLRLFGVIPIKDVKLCPVERPELIPGGQPFGIKLLMEGVMVVNTGEVRTSKGLECPAEDCGLEKGDVIISANSIPISENKQIQKIISSSKGNPINIVYLHDNRRISTSLTPVLSDYESCYKAGLWVRDSTAGIGTITFYEPSTNRFGGLGHPVCDSDTGEMIPVSSGETVDVTINKVVKGTSGTPGELHGCFASGLSSGVIYRNNRCGVFGEQFELPEDCDPLPMALKQETEKGAAYIRTTIDGEGPKEYSIEIEDIDYSSEDMKNMIIRVTDKELLEKAGGIVQGMSGSPIIQNGRIVGAVTHVLVNDPERGFGIFAENMYELGLS